MHTRTLYGSLTPIPGAVSSPLTRAQPVVERGPALSAPSLTAERDHGLSLHRFLGAVQILGALTLIAAYALGGPSLNVAWAASALVAVGVLQLGAGVLWLARARTLEAQVRDRPGSFVAAMLAPAMLVVALGGSEADTLWVTSAQCWLIAAGFALPGWRLFVATGLVAVTSTVVWVAVEGDRGGYDADGDYIIAVIAMVKVVVVGLWLGQMIGRMWTVLARWHLIERHERGVVAALRAQLAVVDDRARVVAEQLRGVGEAGGELAALRARLERGVSEDGAGSERALGQILDDIEGEFLEVRTGVSLVRAASPEVRAVGIDALVADALVSVVRRQLGNVIRHAPDATTVTLELRVEDDAVRCLIEDDGGGSAPAELGSGSRWSDRQLARVGGQARYYDAVAGVGYEVSLPVAPPDRLAAGAERSIAIGLDRFALGMFSALRISGYIGDSIWAHSLDGIGMRWWLIPFGAVVIEFALRRGVPGREMSRRGRTILAAAASLVLTLACTLPPGSPDDLVPLTTSVVVPAMLLLERSLWPWIMIQVARVIVVLPLILDHGGSVVELLVIYPVVFSLLIVSLRRFLDRAAGLETEVLDTLGRARLASATVSSLSLRHDAVDALLRAAPDALEVRDAGADLEDAIRDLELLAAGSVDARSVFREGLVAALPVPVTDAVESPEAAGSLRTAGLLDRLALIELAGATAEERLSCAPPGVLGRRRVTAATLEVAAEGGVKVTVSPVLRAPDPVLVQGLATVAASVGAEVRSTGAGVHVLLQPGG